MVKEMRRIWSVFLEGTGPIHEDTGPIHEDPGPIHEGSTLGTQPPPKVLTSCQHTLGFSVSAQELVLGDGHSDRSAWRVADVSCLSFSSGNEVKMRSSLRLVMRASVKCMEETQHPAQPEMPGFISHRSLD